MNSAVRAVITIRSASIADIPMITAIERASFSDPWNDESFNELLRSSVAIFLVAEIGEARSVAGYVVAVAMGDEAEILNLAVAPNDRKRGLGGELLDAALAAVEQRGAGDVFLEVRESNRAALALYESRRFSALGRRSRYYRNPVEDALILRRAVER